MGEAKRKILLALGGLLTAVAIVGSYMFNKEGPNISNAVAIKVNAATLYETFAKDTNSAKQKYLDKILEVSGAVTQVNKNQQNQVIVLLKTNTKGASLNCTMEGPINKLITGDHINVKGICNGLGQADVEFGILPDVYLSRCHLVR